MGRGREKCENIGQGKELGRIYFCQELEEWLGVLEGKGKGKDCERVENWKILEEQEKERVARKIKGREKERWKLEKGQGNGKRRRKEGS